MPRGLSGSLERKNGKEKGKRKRKREKKREEGEGRAETPPRGSPLLKRSHFSVFFPKKNAFGETTQGRLGLKPPQTPLTAGAG